MLKILKSGNIQGGECNWIYDSEQNGVHYWGNVKVKFGPFKKTFSFDDVYHIERDKLLSSNVHVGLVIDLDDGGQLEVVSVVDNKAVCEVESSSYHGTIDLDLSAELIDVVRVNVKVNLSGVKVTIKAEKV